MTAAGRVTVLAGGYGGAKLSHGMALASAAAVGRGEQGLELSIVANTGDDLELHGLCVSPDLDTLLYTLAGLANEETGWGVRDETWSSAAMLARLGAPTWFQLGDRDLGTNLWRTARLREGQRLTEVTAGLTRSPGGHRPTAAHDRRPVRTELLTADGWLEFQEYFVHRHHSDAVTALRYQGAESAGPPRRCCEPSRARTCCVFAPSNPFLSIGTILAVPGIADALRGRPGAGRGRQPHRRRCGAPGTGRPAVRDPRRRGIRAGRRPALPGAICRVSWTPLVIDTLDDALRGPIPGSGSRCW